VGCGQRRVSESVIRKLSKKIEQTHMQNIDTWKCSDLHKAHGQKVLKSAITIPTVRGRGAVYWLPSPRPETALSVLVMKLSLLGCFLLFLLDCV